MGTKLYVGNLPFDITEDDLRTMLSQHGPVNDIAVVMDKLTGRASAVNPSFSIQASSGW